jgi:hypothetical protein
VGLVAAAGLFAFGDNSPDSEVAEPVARPVVPAQARTPAVGELAPHILRLQPRHALIGADGLGAGGDLFVRHDWTPPPPLPFTFIGKAYENGAWEVYLSRSGKITIVKPKTVIDGIYRVDAIAPPILTFTYLPLNQVQQLNIGAFE